VTILDFEHDSAHAQHALSRPLRKSEMADEQQQRAAVLPLRNGNKDSSVDFPGRWFQLTTSRIRYYTTLLNMNNGGDSASGVCCGSTRRVTDQFTITLMEAVSNTGGVTTVFTRGIEAVLTSTCILYANMEEDCVRETNAPCAHGMEVAPSLARTSSSRDLHDPRFPSNFHTLLPARQTVSMRPQL
jgi:hypothetical protein